MYVCASADCWFILHLCMLVRFNSSIDFLCICSWGALPGCHFMFVVSLLPVWGMGTWQYGIRAKVATMGLYGPRRCNDRSRIAFCLAAIRNLRTAKISRIFLSADSRVIGRLEVPTSDVAEGLAASHSSLRLRKGFGRRFCGRRKWFARPQLRKPKSFSFRWRKTVDSRCCERKTNFQNLSKWWNRRKKKW